MLLYSHPLVALQIPLELEFLSLRYHHITSVMSLLPQNQYPIFKSLSKFHKCHHPRRAVFYAAATTSTSTATNPKCNHNQLVVEPRLVPPPTLVTPSDRTVLLNDPSLQSTWSHRAWVASGCITVLIPLAKSVAGAAESQIWVEPILAGLIGYVLADLASGVYHWAIDNYGSASTPIFGAQIEAFQGHHKWPWIITRRQFANNLHALARTITFVVLPIDFLCIDPILQAFVGVCSGCIMFSQQFHAWAHGTKSRLPPVVVALQDIGLLVSRSQHGAHHRPPYNGNYCIVNGVWNEVLDNQKVFEALEMILFFKLGLRPRSWSEPSSKWVEETDP